MQILDSYEQKNSLLNTMNRFIGAVNNMDQTVMVPSLLRDVPLDHRVDVSAARTASAAAAYLDQDMYSSYVLLKSIRNDIEWGVVPGEGRGKDSGGVVPGEGRGKDSGGVAAEDEDLEKQFHVHLQGLHAVLSKLTRKANTLTTRYKEEIGCGN